MLQDLWLSVMMITTTVAMPRARLLVRYDQNWKTVEVNLSERTNATEKAMEFCDEEECVTMLTKAIGDVDTFLYYEMCKELEEFLRSYVNPEMIEGHTATWVDKVVTLRKIAREAPVNGTICEVGFNAGHSSLNWLTSRPDVSVVAFDRGMQTAPSGQGDIPYGPLGVQFLLEKFPGRLVVINGDSTLTLPAVLQTSWPLRCDVVFVDGAHEKDIALADLMNAKKFVDTSKWNRVIVDDLGDGAVWQRDVKETWDTALSTNLVHRELFKVENAEHAVCRVSPVQRCHLASSDCNCSTLFDDLTINSHRAYCCAAACDLQEEDLTDLVSWVPTRDIPSFGPCPNQPPALHPDLPTSCDIAIGEY